MKKNLLPKFFLVISTPFLACLIFYTCSFAADFTSDMILKTDDRVMKGKTFIKGENIRQEIEIAGKKQVMIIRKDKDVVWMLMPENKMYLEMPGSKGLKNVPQMGQEELEKKAEKKGLGREKINGYNCEKYQFTFYDKSIGTMTQWFSKKLNFPIKIEMNSPSTQMTTEYKNIKEKAVSDELFEVPSGYKKMSMPGMPGGSSGGMHGNHGQY